MSNCDIYSPDWITDQIVNNPHFSLMIIDDQCRLIFINDTYLRLMGFRREDILGRHIDEITPMGRTPEILKTGKAQVGYLLPINGVDTIAGSYPIIQDGRIVGVFGTSIFLDMGEALSFEAKLHNLCMESRYQNKISRMDDKFGFDNLIGQNTAFLKFKELASAVAKTDGTILITGESGTGKDLLAKAIHASSPREHRPFVRINCAAIPDNLLESELFGYDEGTFTGGIKGGKKGKFEVANTGTIFLDEIGELPLAMQTKLLNVLQEKEIEPLGSIHKVPKKIDVRVIAATNRNLEDMVSKGTFRQDLFYRLNVIRLEVPPLRERKDDLPLLVEWIIKKLNIRNQTIASSIDPQVNKLFYEYCWPGNVRELENIIERGSIRANMAGSELIKPQHVSELVDLLFKSAGQIGENFETDLKLYIQNAEKILIENVLSKAKGDKLLAAQRRLWM